MCAVAGNVRLVYLIVPVILFNEQVKGGFWIDVQAPVEKDYMETLEGAY